jgi:chaperonin cofactor prefoldin
MVEEDANVYKLVGPVLVKQELAGVCDQMPLQRCPISSRLSLVPFALHKIFDPPDFNK